jgi:hypothetical protein
MSKVMGGESKKTLQYKNYLHNLDSMLSTHNKKHQIGNNKLVFWTYFQNVSWIFQISRITKIGPFLSM